MGWNVEVACVRLSGPESVGQVVPDVFASTGAVVGFEDATSVSRGTDLSVGVVGEWAVLIDVECRLSAAVPWLIEASEASEVVVVRVADQPLAVQYRNGVAAADHSGAVACVKALGRARSRSRVDGERVACDLLRAWTRIGFPDDLWAVRFTIFAAG